MSSRIVSVAYALAVFFLTSAPALAAVRRPPTVAVPEPSTLALLAIGVGGLAAASRLRRRKK